MRFNMVLPSRPARFIVTSSTLRGAANLTRHAPSRENLSRALVGPPHEALLRVIAADAPTRYGPARARHYP
jgi:hypothetical protein